MRAPSQQSTQEDFNMKKYSFIFLALLPACTSMGPKGVIAFGTDIENIAWSPNQIVAGGINNSKSFQNGTKVVNTGLVTWGTVATVKATIDGMTSTKNAETAAGLSATRSREITKRAVSADKVKTTAILNPVEPVPAAP